jgi:hypothetical protein
MSGAGTPSLVLEKNDKPAALLRCGYVTNRGRRDNDGSKRSAGDRAGSAAFKAAFQLAAGSNQYRAVRRRVTMFSSKSALETLDERARKA